MVTWVIAKVCVSYSPKPVNITFFGKKDFVGVINLMILRWREYPASSRWTLVIPRGPEASERGPFDGGSRGHTGDVIWGQELRNEVNL